MPPSRAIWDGQKTRREPIPRSQAELPPGPHIRTKADRPTQDRPAEWKTGGAKAYFDAYFTEQPYGRAVFGFTSSPFIDWPREVST